MNGSGQGRAEPKCFGVIYTTSEYEYRGSGYHASFGLLGDDPDTVFAPDVIVGATTFDDAEAAQRFVDDEGAKWRDCANRPLIDKDTDSQAALTWVAATPAVANGVRTVSRTLEAVSVAMVAHARWRHGRTSSSMRMCVPRTPPSPPDRPQRW